MTIAAQVKVLEEKRHTITKEIDAELARLRILCDHTNIKSFTGRCRSQTKCLQCGKWWG